MNLPNQIKIAKTRLTTATLENNPTEKEVWKSILISLVQFEQVIAITENRKTNTAKWVE